MSSVQPVVPFMECPIPFITDSSKEWKVSEDAVQILNAISVPISVVAIVGMALTPASTAKFTSIIRGKYRTGKSFLMNRLAGESSGFKLGSKVQAQTKGIWMWARPHHNDAKRCLILLDTEGLYDVKLSDEKRDMEIFTLSVLLSNCLVFNTVGSIDSTFIQELQLVAELTETIKVSKKNTEDDEESGMEFAAYFPSLFVVLRDFHLKLEIDDREMTPTEYLEDSLTLKTGTSKRIKEYNGPREAIIKYFKRRTCFALPKPVHDDDQLSNLDEPNIEIKPEFTLKSDQAIQAIFDEAKPMDMAGNVLKGQSYLHVVQEYVRCMNDGGVPCIESAIDVMKKNACENAYTTSLAFYKNGVASETADKLPTTVEYLGQVHQKYYHEAFEKYRETSMTDPKDKYAVKLEGDMNQDHQLILGQNKDISSKKSKVEIERCFASIEKRIGSNEFDKKGGHAEYRKAMVIAVSDYKKVQCLGPMMEIVLEEYLKRRQEIERRILNADNLLSNKEKEDKMKKAELERIKEGHRLATAEREKQAAQLKREMAQRDHEMKEMAKKHDENYKLMIERQDKALKDKNKEMKELIDQKMNDQAAEHKKEIAKMEKKRKDEKEQRQKVLQQEESRRKEREDDKRQMEQALQYQREQDRTRMENLNLQNVRNEYENRRLAEQVQALKANEERRKQESCQNVIM